MEDAEHDDFFIGCIDLVHNDVGSPLTIHSCVQGTAPTCPIVRKFPETIGLGKDRSAPQWASSVAASCRARLMPAGVPPAHECRRARPAPSLKCRALHAARAGGPPHHMLKEIPCRRLRINRCFGSPNAQWRWNEVNGCRRHATRFPLLPETCNFETQEANYGRRDLCRRRGNFCETDLDRLHSWPTGGTDHQVDDQRVPDRAREDRGCNPVR